MNVRNLALGVALVTGAGCAQDKTPEKILADTRCDALAKLEGIRHRGAFFIQKSGNDIVAARLNINSQATPIDRNSLGEQEVIDSLKRVMSDGDVCAVNGLGHGYTLDLRALTPSEELAARVNAQ